MSLKNLADWAMPPEGGEEKKASCGGEKKTPCGDKKAPCEEKKASCAEKKASCGEKKASCSQKKPEEKKGPCGSPGKKGSCAPGSCAPGSCVGYGKKPADAGKNQDS